MPCDIVDELENNVEAATDFVSDIQNGEVPSLIQDLPEEVIGAFQSILGTALQLPGAIWDTATDVAEGAVDIFDDLTGSGDGTIAEDLASLPEAVGEGVVDAWEGVTAGLDDAW